MVCIGTARRRVAHAIRLEHSCGAAARPKLDAPHIGDLPPDRGYPQASLEGRAARRGAQPLKEHNLYFDLEAAVKNAVLFGVAVGIISAAAFLILAYSSYLAAPKTTVAAAVRRPCGFQLPD
jgi:hypothetical protein